MTNDECRVQWQPYHGAPPGFPPLGARYADELFALYGGCLEQVETCMEAEGYSKDEISVQLQRLAYQRAYQRAYSPV